MAKRLVVKTGEYTNNQGETKGEYIKVGVMMDGDNGPYLLLDPCVNIAGCLAKQNIMNHKSGKQVRDSLLVSVFEDDNQQQRQAAQQPGYQNQPNPTYSQRTQPAKHQQAQQKPSGAYDGSSDDDYLTF